MVYGRATQNGCSLALCKSPARPVPASPTPHSHGWPSYVLAPAPAGDCSYQRGSEGRAPLLVSRWYHLMSIPPITGSLPFRSGGKTVLPAVCCTWWGVAPGPGFTHVSSPIHQTTDVSVADSGLFLRSWSWVATGLVGLQGAAQRLGWMFTSPQINKLNP